MRSKGVETEGGTKEPAGKGRVERVARKAELRLDMSWRLWNGLSTGRAKQRMRVD